MDAVNGVRTSLGDPKPVNFDLATSAAAKQATQAEMQKAVETGQISKELERGLSKEQKEAMDKQIKQQSEQMKKRGELNTAFNAGMEAMNAKNWEAAVENFTKASELDPAQVAVWAQLGEANLRVASTKTGADFDAAIGKALQAYSKSIELKPDDPASHNNYALALVRAKKLPEAQAELKKAADLDPQNGGKYYYNLGAVLTNAGQYDTAGEAFKKAIELTPTYADAYYQYGMTLSSKMQTTADGKVTAPDEMKNAFKKYLELQPNGPNAEAAKAMLQSVEGSVQTKFSDPTKKAEPAKKKK
jgi:tetratricopeptide (TPR) repeat protein